MKRQSVSFYLFLLLLASCGSDTGIVDSPEVLDPNNKSLDSFQVQHIRHILKTGPNLYKRNCAVCHRPGGATCGPFDETRDLSYTFSNLTLDSLAYFASYIKDTRSTILSPSRNPYILTRSKDSLHHHTFGQTLSDSLIKTLVDYIWIVHRNKK